MQAGERDRVRWRSGRYAVKRGVLGSGRWSPVWRALTSLGAVLSAMLVLMFGTVLCFVDVALYSIFFGFLCYLIVLSFICICCCVVQVSFS